MKYVNIYVTESRYGGAEEGGWYYTAGEPVECAGQFSQHDDAIALADKIRGQLKDPETYHMGVNSNDGADADGNGDDNYLTVGGAWGYSRMKVLVQDHPPKPYPSERPFYN